MSIPTTAERSAMITGDLRDEEYREYEFFNSHGRLIVYRITQPHTLFMREGGTTHRVLDSNGIVHCLLGMNSGTILRWKPKEGANPVAF